MVDAHLQSELLAACSSIGYSDGSKYHLEADCLETVKDLIKYLRSDDDSHQVRRFLGETKVMQKDLLPILKDHIDNKELFDVTLRFLINLTNPVLLLFKEELPEEKTARQQFLQILTQQQEFKEAFADDGVWRTLAHYLGEILQQEWMDWEEEERLIAERILILVRNVLSVPSSPEEERRTDDDASIHDKVLWGIHLANFEDMLLYIASSEDKQELCMHVLEIIRLMLKEQDPVVLANTGLQRSVSEKKKDEEELVKKREMELLRKQQQSKKMYNARHSRFSGTYCVANMKSISNKELIVHHHINDINSISFDSNKKRTRIPKNRRPLEDVTAKRRSTLAIRLFLQGFCVEFLNGAYNSIMYTVKSNLNRALGEEHDESYYLWAIEFFLQFNRSHNFKLELITESLNAQQFHYIQTLLENFYDMMTTDKKKIPLWSRRMHNALKAYKELFMTLFHMGKSTDASLQNSLNVLKSKIFYVIEYRELPLILLQNFDEVKMTKTYLKDLVETVHIFLKMLEGFCGKHKHVIVQNKQKKRKKKVKKQVSLNEEELLSKWNRNYDAIIEVINSSDLPTAIPFDSLSELSENEQKENSMRKIHTLLRGGNFEEAVSLYHSCRDVWPEGDIFGSENAEPSEEVESLKMIYMANLSSSGDADVYLNEEIDSDNEEEEKEDAVIRMSEQEFKFQEFIRRFAHTKVIQAYAVLFRNFFNNTEYTNHCILKMFHRLAWDSKLPGIFFQASLFQMFYKILKSPSASGYKEMIKFIKYIWRQFAEVSKTNKKVFVELLFWKTNKEALELEVGYSESSSSSSATNKLKGFWKEEEEYELEKLFNEFKDAASDEKDVVDLILENIINTERSRRGIIKKLKAMDLVTNVRELSRKAVKVGGSKPWSEIEEEELRMLFEEHKDSMNPVARIMDYMYEKRPRKRLIDKILELGLIQDRKELRKKTIKKVKAPSQKKNAGEAFLAANADSDDESDDENSERDSFSEDEDIPSVTPASIEKVLKEVDLKDLKESVQWMSELLKEAADDREEDGDFQPIPILPLTSSNTDAIEDPSFQKLLKLIGLQPPLKAQERFWRIPSSLSVKDLRKRSQFIAGQSSTTSEDEVKERENQTVKSSPMRQVLGTLDNYNDIQNTNISEETEPSSYLKNKVKLVLNSDSENDQNSSEENSPVKNNKNLQNSRKNIIPLDDDSEDEAPMVIDNFPDKNREGVISRKRNIIDSDEENDNQSFSKKPRAVILDDSDDD